jgi:hypothetical protein
VPRDKIEPELVIKTGALRKIGHVASNWVGKSSSCEGPRGMLE